MGAVVCVGRLQTVCVGKKAAAACVHTPSLAFQHPCAKEEGHSGKATLGVTVTQPKDDDTLHSNSHDAERDHIDNDTLYVDFRSHGLPASVFIYSWYTSGRLPNTRRHFSNPKIQEDRLLI